ncbi:MAG TPA: hypothetical protein VFZ96_07585 [Actinomycetota bacterium]|nr:hypothetical protein [Actinomycetota bacterium]
MSAAGQVHGDERGLVGKILALWLVLAVLLAVLAYDGIRIAVTKFRVADAAQTAAFESATTLRSTRGDRDAAYRAAQQAVAEADEGLRLAGFVIDPRTNEIRVTVAKKAPTILVERIGFLSSLARARTTEASSIASP